MLIHPNCKINIGLHIINRRPDGYHNIETIFYPIPLTDELEIRPAPRFVFEQEGIPINGAPEDNLCVRAVRLLQQDFPQVAQIHLRLQKNIPFGAGLGGGSADATFTLRMLNDMFHLQLTSHQLCHYAAQIGADSPFFVDNRPAYATGIGDVLQPIQFSLSGMQLLLLKPPVSVSTAGAYAAITPRGTLGVPVVNLQEVVKRPVSQWQDVVQNDFEPVVLQQYPAIARCKQWLLDNGAAYASLTGSGAAVFGLFPHALPSMESLESSVFHFATTL